MNLLYLCHRIPYPPNKGDKIRSFNEIKHLSRRHAIDLACLADEPSDLKHAKDLQPYCRKLAVVPLDKRAAKVRGLAGAVTGKSISVGYFYKKSLQIVVDRWLTETPYDAILCFSSPMAEYVFRTRSPNFTLPKNGAGSPILVMDFCDVDSDKWRQYAGCARFPSSLIYRNEFRKLLSYEGKINRLFDHSLFASEAEAELFRSLCPKAKGIAVVQNGVDTDYFSPENPAIKPLPKPPKKSMEPEKPILLFTGAMDYQANVDGVCWFCRDIFPFIRRSLPGVRFLIVGGKPVPAVRRLAQIPDVEVTGFVDDVRPYYMAADLCVIPLRMARGVQNKVLEAMAMRKPAVCTSAANRGVGALDGIHLIQRNEAKAFADAVIDLLSEPLKAKRMSLAAHSFVLEQFDWRMKMAKIEKLLA